MRLHKARLRGWLAFPDEVSIDFDALPEGVIAVCGENGAGKTSLVELLFPGSLYGTLPTRGGLADAAVARDAFVETLWSLPDGRKITVRQEVDAKTRRRSTSVLDGALQPLTSRALGTEYAGWASGNLPPEDFYLATAFMAQRSTGFLGLSMPARKALVLRALGLDRYETWATRAKERREAARGAVDRTVVAQGLARAGAIPRDEAAARVIAAEGALVAARETHQRAADALASAEDAARDAVALAGDHERVARLRREAQAALRDAEDAAHASTVAIEDLERAVAATDGAVAAQGRLQGERDAVDALRAAHEAARAQREEAASALRVLQDEHRDAGNRLVAMQRERAALERRCEQLVHWRNEAAAVQERKRAWSEALEALEAIESEIIAKTHLRLASARDRIGSLVARHETIETTLSRAMKVDDSVQIEECVEYAHGVARDAIVDDDAAGKAAEAAGPRVQELQAALPLAKTRAQSADASLRRAEEAAARLPDAEEARAAADAIGTQEEDVRAGGTALARRVDEARALFEQRERDVLEAGKALRAAEATVRATEALAARAAEGAAARARLQEFESRHPALVDALRAAQERLAATPAPGQPPVQPALDGPRAAVSRATDAVAAAERALAVAEEAARASAEAEERVRVATEERHAAERDLSDWAALHHALGRDGIQACEIDAAGPELSTLATDLLAACYGPRWSLALTTTQPLKDGSGDREVYDLLVTDADARDPRECPVARKSGGEGVIVGESIALALSTFAASRAGGAAGATWVRDESGSALDAQKAVAYVHMLRRALRLAGAGRALLVTHSSPAQSVCDARIVVAGARVTVE